MRQPKMSAKAEGAWNNKKDRLKWLQERLSKSPHSATSFTSDSARSDTTGIPNLRRGKKPPVPPLSRDYLVDKHVNNSDSLSVSTDEISCSSPVPRRTKKSEKRRNLKKAHRLSLTVAPQPPTMLFAPPPMPPVFMNNPYAVPPYPYIGSPAQNPFMVPYQMQNAKSHKSNLKETQHSEGSEDGEEEIEVKKTKKKKTKKVRIVEKKEAVDAETSTCDELTRLATTETDKKDTKTESKPPADNANPSEFNWDAFFQPRMAPPLVFEDSETSIKEDLSMLSNSKKPYSKLIPESQMGRLAIDTSNEPTPIIYQPSNKDMDPMSSRETSSISSKDDRTIAWLSGEPSGDKEIKKDVKLTPIAEEVLRSYESLKMDQFGSMDAKYEGELLSANQRLERYFNQLRDLDHFILDQETKLLDRQHKDVIKKAHDVKPITTYSLSPRKRNNITIMTPQAPPVSKPTLISAATSTPKLVTTGTSVPRQSALLLEEVYGSIDKPKPETPKAKTGPPPIQTNKSPRFDRTTITGRFSTSRPFANFIVDGVLQELLDEILVFEIGRTLQASSVEAVSALIEKRLAEDLEEQKAFTQQIIERLPSPGQIIGKAMEKTEETVQNIVEKTTASVNASAKLGILAAVRTSTSTTPVEDVDLFFRELTLPKASELVIKDVIEVDLPILVKEALLEESIESVFDDFLANQVVGNEMVTIAIEALSEVELKKRRYRRKQMKNAIEGQALYSLVMDICLSQVAQQSVILSPFYESEVGLHDWLLQELLHKMNLTVESRNLVAECLPIRRYHEKVVSDIAMEAVVNELIKSLDIDIAEVDDYETGRDMGMLKSSAY